MLGGRQPGEEQRYDYAGMAYHSAEYEVAFEVEIKNC